MRRILIGLPIACLLLGLTPTQAGAATVRYAADGERCTIVGTSHADVLVGTSHHDVICGLGGNDVIHGGGGDDTIDGGSGNDTLYGGSGNDLLIGGAGNDKLYGNAGNDRLYGGSGKNTLSGGGGKNTLSKTGNGPKPVSTCGSSPAVMTAAAAAVCTPTVPVSDNTAPVIVSDTATPSTVDVSDADQTVAVSVHVTDNIGVTQVSGLGTGLSPVYDGLYATVAYGTLTSGTAQDGVWTLELIANKGTPAGTSGLTVNVMDGSGNTTSRYDMYGITFADTDPDTAPPVVSDLSFSSSQVDVRSAAVTVNVTAHITDDDTGVDASALPWAYLTPPTPTDPSAKPAPLWAYWTRVSGSDRDAIYSLTFGLPQGTIGGTWTLSTSNFFHDHAGNTVWIPNATLDVIGSASTAPPTVVGVTVNHAKIDVCPTGATEQIDLHVQGADAAAQVEVHVPGPYDTYVTNATLVSGTPADGIWRATLPFMPTTPPGVYSIGAVQFTDRGEMTTQTLGGTSFTIVPAGAPTS
ncbi:MAG TPA: hypothetical protein VHU88_11545 [Sporichthyaceae bacterium]|nr:hypothetical protein [Sporichthyaceae bacterium]